MFIIEMSFLDIQYFNMLITVNRLHLLFSSRALNTIISAFGLIFTISPIVDVPCPFLSFIYLYAFPIPIVSILTSLKSSYSKFIPESITAIFIIYL